MQISLIHHGRDKVNKIAILNYLQMLHGVLWAHLLSYIDAGDFIEIDVFEDYLHGDLDTCVPVASANDSLWHLI